MADVGEPFDTLASVEDMLTSLPDFSDPLPGLEGQHALQPAESAEDDARCSDWFLQMIGNDALHGSAFGACLNDSAPQTWGTIPSAAAETAAAHSRAAMPVPGLPHRSARDLLQGGAFNNHGSKTQMMYSNPFHMVAQQQLYEQEWKQQQGHSGLAVYGGSQSMPLLAALPVGLQLQQSLHTSSNLSTELHTNAPSPRSEQLISKHSSHGPCCEGSPCGPASFSSLPQGPNSSSSLHASRNVLANSLLEPRGSAKIKLATGARGRRTRAAAAACAKGRSDSCGGGGSGNVPFKSKSSGNLATKHSSPAANGGVAAAAGLPIKDTTQRRNAQIRQLEAELAKKASLVAKLEEDRRELLTRERLLQLQVWAVNVCAQRLAPQSAPPLAATLRLQSLCGRSCGKVILRASRECLVAQQWCWRCCVRVAVSKQQFTYMQALALERMLLLWRAPCRSTAATARSRYSVRTASAHTCSRSLRASAQTSTERSWRCSFRSCRTVPRLESCAWRTLRSSGRHGSTRCEGAVLCEARSRGCRSAAPTSLAAQSHAPTCLFSPTIPSHMPTCLLFLHDFQPPTHLPAFPP